MKKIGQVVRCKKGSFHLIMAALIIAVLAVALLVTEIMRIHDIQQHLDDELYRATNLGIKAAMYDSHRIDSISKFNDVVAEEAFYQYLYEDLELGRNLEKWEDGQLMYKLEVRSLDVDGINVRMKVSAVAYAPTAFKLWTEEWEIPIEVTSRNMRVD